MPLEPKPAIYFHIMEATRPGAFDNQLTERFTAVPRRSPMYNWAIAFIVMSLAAAVFALGGFGAPYDQLGALLSPLFLALFVACVGHADAPEEPGMVATGGVSIQSRGV